MKLTKYEKETIINFNEGEKEASIYTFNASLKRRLAEFARKYPALCRLKCSTAEERDLCHGQVETVHPVSPPYSEARKAAASAYAKEHGFQILIPEQESA